MSTSSPMKEKTRLNVKLDNALINFFDTSASGGVIRVDSPAVTELLDAYSAWAEKVPERRSEDMNGLG